MEATERTRIENDEGLESFASAWANALIYLNDKPRISERDHLCIVSIRKDQSSPSR